MDGNNQPARDLLFTYIYQFKTSPDNITWPELTVNLYIKTMLLPSAGKE
jgi:hypothetical protein